MVVVFRCPVVPTPLPRPQPSKRDNMRTGARAPVKGRKTGHNGKSSAAGIFFSRPMAYRGLRPLFLQPRPSPPFFWCRWQGQGFFRTPEKEGQQDCGSGGRAWGRGAVTQAPTRPTPSRSIASSRSTILYPNRTTFFRFPTLPLTLLLPRSSPSICEFPRPHRVSAHTPPKPAQWHPPSSICAARPSR